MVLASLDVVVGVDGSDEVTGDQLGALVDQLIEGMLAIGARLTPDNGASGIVHLVAGSSHISMK